MKQGLQRIEATLRQLPRVSTIPHSQPAAPLASRSFSFKIDDACHKRHQQPQLPQFAASSSSHKNSIKVCSDLQELPQTAPISYEVQLQEVVRQIQAVYLEGPLVDGWLESYPLTPQSGTALSQESAQRQMDYLTEVYSFQQGKVSCALPRPGYRLCGFDANNQKWCRPCPLDQLPSVSIAIARYQRLQQLVQRKQDLERRLQEK